MLLFYRRLRPGLASQRIKSLCFLIHGLDHDERKTEHFVFLFALFVLQTHFILRPSTLICIPISLLFVVWGFLISRGLYWLFCGHFTRPRVYSDFFASYRASWVEKREENRCSVRLSRLDCRGAFCIMGFYSFFNDGLKVDWRDRAEVAHRFVLVCRWFFGLLLDGGFTWFLYYLGGLLLLSDTFFGLYTLCWLAIEPSLELLYRMESCPSTRGHRIIGTEISLISKWM